MTEVFFRVRGQKNMSNDWIEGYFVPDLAEMEGRNARFATIVYFDPERVVMRTAETIKRETVGRFTGRTDKNGKKIFEGDILAGAWKTKLVIYFDEDYLQFRAREVSSYARENTIDYYDNGKLEVIGNIYDNPELLRK